MASFVHLHTHSDFSLLKSTLSIPSLVEAAKRLHMPAIALTDSANMYGAMEFFIAAKKHSLNPLIGCEFQLRLANNHLTQLVLIAENNEGYANLSKLSSLSFTNNNTIPCLELKDLKKKRKSLIALSGGFFGAIDYYLRKDSLKQAKEILDLYRECFGVNNLYFEIQKHSGFKEEDEWRKFACEFAQQNHIPLVATNNVHYLDIDDVNLHETLMAIDEQDRVIAPTISKRKLQKEDKKSKRKMPSAGYHFKNEAEMQNDFQEFPQALSNTLVIANRCHVDIEDKKLHMPQINVASFSAKQTLSLKEESLRKLKNKIPEITTEYHERLHYEIEIIEKMEFSSYFLIVADFVNAAKEKGILVGPGRGSAAGSLVSYALGITNVDPIAYDLLFERFLNPERVSMPDIDIDFQDNRRDEVIKYTQNKYGKDHVCQIITYGKLKMKAVLKDIARVFGLSFEQSNNLSALVGKEKNLSLEYENNIEFRSLINSSEQYKNIYHYAKNLEGLTRQTGIHAAGVILADKPIATYCPVGYDDRNTCPYTSQYEAELLENYCGLVKMDFLGLATLTVIDNTIKSIKQYRKTEIDLEQIPLDDSKTYRLFSESQTRGIFQFESAGMSKYLKELQPDNIDHLVAMNAMYRPGPLSWIPVYIGKKRNLPIQFNQFEDEKRYKKLEAICRQNETLKNILAPTYLIPIYQEQIMQIGRDYAGFTLGEADIMRRAMGKKKVDELINIKAKFIAGAEAKGESKNNADFLFEEIIMPFSGYGFNKSHSVCYAIIAYQTAYLKANYTVDFLISFLNLKIEGSGEKLNDYIAEAKFLNVEILPPDINQSAVYFKQIPGTNKILYALSGIKGMGKNTSQKIILEREKNGVYKDFFDLYYRNHKSLNKQNINFLIKSLALTEIETLNPKQMLNQRQQLDDIIEAYLSLKESGQGSMFDTLVSATNKNDLQEKLRIFRNNVAKEEISFLELQEYEKEALGFNIKFITEQYLADLFEKKSTVDIKDLAQSRTQKQQKIAGIIKSIYLNVTKKNSLEMASLVLQRHDGTIKLVCFPKQWATIKEQKNHQDNFFLKDRKTAEGQTVTCSFNIFKRDENVTYQVTNIEFLDSQTLLQNPHRYHQHHRQSQPPKTSSQTIAEPPLENITPSESRVKKDLPTPKPNKSAPLEQPPNVSTAGQKEVAEKHLAILLNEFLSTEKSDLLKQKLTPYLVTTGAGLSTSSDNHSTHYPLYFYLKQEKEIKKIVLPYQLAIKSEILQDQEQLKDLRGLSFVSDIYLLAAEVKISSKANSST